MSDLVIEDAWLPMPHNIFERMQSAIEIQTANNTPLVLLGLSGYLTLLDNDNKRTAFFALREWIDNTTEREAVWLLHYDDSINLIVKDVFANPRYRQGRQLITIKAEQNALQSGLMPAEIKFIGAHLVSLVSEQCDSIQKCLRYLEDHPNDSSTRWVVVNAEKRLPGLCAEVEQLVSLSDFVYAIYGVECAGLSEPALSWICSLARDIGDGKTLLDVLKAYFFPEGQIPRRVLCAFDTYPGFECEVLLWLVKRIASRGSYLEFILKQDGICSENFRSAYVTSAAACLDNFREYAAERRDAIQEANVTMSDADIRLFIAHCSKESTARVSPWLNCGTFTERTELLQRCFSDGIVSYVIKSIYPEVAAYLSPSFIFSESTLHEYFKEYRELKTTNRITPEFYKKAQYAYSSCQVQSRNMLVQQYITDEQCALLVVDAMGAEWLPMLVEMAQERNLGVEFLAIGEVNLPTTTEFNSINWPFSERQLPAIKRFDNIAHNGAEMHEKRLPEENLAAAFDVIGNDIIPRVANGLTNFDRVLVTADHGSSRLAVLARQAEPVLSQKLICEAEAEIVDRRYRTKAAQGECPPELEETLDGRYWVVRGYDRLPKKGGSSSFELHGGATLEERLVPVIVFSKEGQFVPIAKKDAERLQIIEKDDFDL